MKCQRCGSERVAEVSAKCKDMFRWKSGKARYEGYVHTPGNEIGGGDYIEFKYCLECGQIQYVFPVPSDWEDEDEE